MEVLIVTGLSGAGKSCVADALEDIGYFCVDNIPTKLIPNLIDLLNKENEYEKVAIVTDTRSGITVEAFTSAILETQELGVPLKTLFVDCKSDVLFSRYKQSRRCHPLMSGKDTDILTVIENEKELYKEIKAKCAFKLDTGSLSVSLCKSRIMGMFSDNSDKCMHIHCLSFGFRYGIPEDADFVFDLRFLPNPYYIPEFKELTGLDESVSSYVMQFDTAKNYLGHILSILDFAVPKCVKEGRSQLVIAVGCTGGHHRSVTFAQLIHKHLKEKGFNVSVSHRDILK